MHYCDYKNTKYFIKEFGLTKEESVQLIDSVVSTHDDYISTIVILSNLLGLYPQYEQPVKQLLENLWPDRFERMMQIISAWTISFSIGDYSTS